MLPFGAASSANEIDGRGRKLDGHGRCPARMPKAENGWSTERHSDDGGSKRRSVAMPTDRGAGRKELNERLVKFLRSKSDNTGRARP